MCHFDGQKITAYEEWGGSELFWKYFGLSDVDDHLDEGPADLENVLFLQFSANDCIQIEVEVVEDAVEAIFVFDYLANAGDFFGFSVVHEWDVLVF